MSIVIAVFQIIDENCGDKNKDSYIDIEVRNERIYNLSIEQERVLKIKYEEKVFIKLLFVLIIGD